DRGFNHRVARHNLDPEAGLEPKALQRLFRAQGWRIWNFAGNRRRNLSLACIIAILREDRKATNQRKENAESFHSVLRISSAARRRPLAPSAPGNPLEAEDLLPWDWKGTRLQPALPGASAREQHS